MEWPKTTHNPEAEAQAFREQFREHIFPELVATHILENMIHDLDDAGFTIEEVREIEHHFLELTEKQKRAVLAVPAQLRPKLFEKYASDVEAGTLTPKDMLADLLAKSERYNYTLGYHLSPREIKPEADGSWTIKGTEKDHRHEDIPMAYYSLNYIDRYKDKPSKYLYIVRAEQKEGSGHYQDNNGAWGHAPSLSIVDMIDLPKIEEEMDTLMKEQQEKEKRELPGGQLPQDTGA